MKIKLNKDIRLSCPGTHVAENFPKVKILYMSFDSSSYPGKPYTKGTIGFLAASQKQNTENPVHQEWYFQSSNDIDFAIIVNPNDVETLWLTQDEFDQLPQQAIDQATFEILIDANKERSH